MMHIICIYHTLSALTLDSWLFCLSSFCPFLFVDFYIRVEVFMDHDIHLVPFFLPSYSWNACTTFHYPPLYHTWNASNTHLFEPLLFIILTVTLLDYTLIRMHSGYSIQCHCPIRLRGEMFQSELYINLKSSQFTCVKDVQKWKLHLHSRHYIKLSLLFCSQDFICLDGSWSV